MKLFCRIRKSYEIARSFQDNFNYQYAKIAQLVERQLPKLKVAGSNPVFRSFARMVELVDTLVSGTSEHCVRVGSSPTSSTNSPQVDIRVGKMVSMFLLSNKNIA